MGTEDFIKHFKYGTLEIMANDIADQIDDHDGFFTGDQKPDPQDIIRHARLIITFGHLIKILCGEGGVPITDLSCERFERLVDKYLPEIKEGLRKKW